MLKKNQNLSIAVAVVLLLAIAVVVTLLVGASSISGDSSDYIHEVNGTISICDPNDSTKCITMQDRNLGASKVGVGCLYYRYFCNEEAVHFRELDDCLSVHDYGNCMGWRLFGDLFESEEDCYESEKGQKSLYDDCIRKQGTEMYGNHYQRGNNYGFPIGCFSYSCSDAITNSATNVLALWSPDYNHKGYNGTLFIEGTYSCEGDYWEDNNHYNGLRGGENDSQENNWGYDEISNVAINVENRQGPCENGYHVPSIGEWNQVLKYWAQENEIDLSDNGEGLKYTNMIIDGLKFQEDFKIPFAGERFCLDARVELLGFGAKLWSSSLPQHNKTAYIFNLGLNSANASAGNVRTEASSVRCFKDVYLSFPSK